MKKTQREKTWGILTTIALTLFILFSSAYTSNKLSNKWRWGVASGNPTSYILGKTTDGGNTWIIVDANIPHEPVIIDDKEYIEYVLISPGIETYQLRVRAVDAAGNQGPYSLISNELKIRGPGKPAFIEE